MPDCPTPKRAIYATEGAAWGALRGWPTFEGARPQAPYRCICRGWHIAPRTEALRHRTAGR